MDSVQITNGTFMAELPNSFVGNTSNVFLAAISDYIDLDFTSALLAEISNWLNLAQIASYLNLEFYKPHVLILLDSLLSGLSDILLVVGSIAWAIFQHQTVSRLTYVPNELQRISHSLKSKPFSDGLFYTARLIWNWLAHVTMYTSFTLRYIPGKEPTLQLAILQLVIISSLPLAIPYDFYSKRPILSMFCLMCWGQLWLKYMYLGLICPLAMSIPLLSELLIPLHFAELVVSACWVPDGREWQYFRDNFYAKVVVGSCREIWRATWIFWPLPTVHLEPLHQQARFDHERDPDLNWPQQSTSKALDETIV